MTSTILLRRSSTANSVPLPAALSLGELAINTNDGIVYMKKNNGSDAIVAIGAHTVTGDVTGSSNGNGLLTLTLPTVNSNVGTYSKVTVNAKGQVTAGTALATADITTALGYTPYNGTTNPNSYVTATSAPVTSVNTKTGAVVLAVADISGAAPLASPTFTGPVVVPNPTAGDSSTLAASTLYVQTSVNGALALSLTTTSVTLTVAQAGNAIFLFTGALTGNTTVYFPASAKDFVVSNRTTGAFTLTIAATGGAGVTVGQGFSSSLICDGTNVVYANNDYSTLTLGSGATGFTQLATDNSTKLATTAYVQSQNYLTAATAPVTKVQGKTGVVTLAAADLPDLMPIAGGTFTGAVKGITATAGDNTTNLATTAFVTNAVSNATAGVASFNTRTGAVTLTSADVNTALGSNAVLASSLGANSGVATLDATGKLTAAQIPASLVGSLNYQGTWNASTNSPALASGVGTKGYYYIVSTAGTTAVDGLSSWGVGDMINFNGSVWQKLDGQASEVTTVFGRTGAVVLLTADITTALGYTPYNGTTNPNAYVTSTTAPVTKVQGKTGVVTLAAADLPDLMPIAGGTFTGAVSGVAPSAGDSSASLITSAFLNNQLTGAASVAVTSSDVTLTAAQYGAGLINITGTLTANVNVIAPTAGFYATVRNQTSGAFSVTVKTASGSGVTVNQGFNQILTTDGTNIVPAFNDLGAISLGSNATGFTQLATDNSTKLATTAYVKSQNYITSAGAPVQTVQGKAGTVTLAAADLPDLMPIAGGTFTGAVKGITATAGDNTTNLATTAFVTAAVAAGGAVTSVNGKTGVVTLAISDLSGTMDGGTY